MITAISVVKNSADVIESMVRGNAVVADNFVVLDNGSTDRTLEILEMLQGEGFQIEVLHDDDPQHKLQERYLFLVHYAVEQYNADWVMPVDDDEIICTNSDEIAPEEIKGCIESLEQDDLYYVNWRNYIPSEEDDPNEVCVMSRQSFCFDDEPEMTTKVIIPAKLVDDSFTIAYGCHYADSDRIRNRVRLNQLRLAHYPVRSAEQIASKALVGWLNNLTMPNRKTGLNYHWEIMYDEVKNGGLPSVDQMQMMCTLYRQYPNDTDHLNIIRKPICLPEKCFENRYTDLNEINLIRNLCDNAEVIAKKYAEMSNKQV
ncbi:MAG: glycosyltransferase family 2 protein [Lachnospiraceae bacterium]|nr:glycosyltransferase family 2 protein [Lachnospiraceae bacterium]